MQSLKVLLHCANQRLLYGLYKIKQSLKSQDKLHSLGGKGTVQKYFTEKESIVYVLQELSFSLYPFLLQVGCLGHSQKYKHLHYVLLFLN